ncbi:hypothetical protein ACW3RS_005693, partial [Escherichia coli]
GFYYNSGEENMFGDVGDAEARLLRRDVPDVTPVQQAPALPVTHTDGAPADTIWTFKGDSSKTLWQVCGGQSSS